MIETELFILGIWYLVFDVVISDLGIDKFSCRLEIILFVRVCSLDEIVSFSFDFAFFTWTVPQRLKILVFSDKLIFSILNHVIVKSPAKDIGIIIFMWFLIKSNKPFIVDIFLELEVLSFHFSVTAL